MPPDDPPVELTELVRNVRRLKAHLDPKSLWCWVGWVQDDGVEVRIADKMTEYVANFLCLKLKEEISADLLRGK